MFFVIIVILIILYSLLVILESKYEYSNIPIEKWTRENGDIYFAVPFYLWQAKKVKEVKKVYYQNSIIDFDGYKYRITDFGGVFERSNGGIFLERELRFFGKPVVSDEINNSISVLQYGNGTIIFNIDNSIQINQLIEAENYINNQVGISEIDKKIMIEFIEKIVNNSVINSAEAKSAYDIFLKYEPLCSFIINLLSGIIGVM